MGDDLDVLGMEVPDQILTTVLIDEIGESRQSYGTDRTRHGVGGFFTDDSTKERVEPPHSPKARGIPDCITIKHDTPRGLFQPR